jgi:AraC-like DNA-binding protein
MAKWATVFGARKSFMPRSILAAANARVTKIRRRIARLRHDAPLRIFAVGLRDAELTPPEHPGWERLAFCARGSALVRAAGRTMALFADFAIVLGPGAALSVREYADVRILYARAGTYAAAGLRLSPLLLALIERFVTRGYLDPAVPGDARLLAVISDEVAAAVPHAPPSLALPRDARAQAAVRLWRDPAGAPTLEQTARLLGCGVRTLERAFRTETGTGAGAWRRAYALMHALSAIARGETTSNAAYHCGYSSASALIHACKRTFGATPSQLVAGTFTTASPPLPGDVSLHRYAKRR